MINVPIDRIVPLTDARDNFSRIVADIENQKDGMYVLTKGGKPAIALININYLSELMKGGSNEPDREPVVKQFVKNPLQPRPVIKDFGVESKVDPAPKIDLPSFDAKIPNNVPPTTSLPFEKSNSAPTPRPVIDPSWMMPDPAKTAPKPETKEVTAPMATDKPRSANPWPVLNQGESSKPLVPTTSSPGTDSQSLPIVSPVPASSNPFSPVSQPPISRFDNTPTAVPVTPIEPPKLVAPPLPTIPTAPLPSAPAPTPPMPPASTVPIQPTVTIPTPPLPPLPVEPIKKPDLPPPPTNPITIPFDEPPKTDSEPGEAMKPSQAPVSPVAATTPNVPATPPANPNATKVQDIEI